MKIMAVRIKNYSPASSKWPFDSPNGGHLIPEKVTNKTIQKVTRKNPGEVHFVILGDFSKINIMGT